VNVDDAQTDAGAWPALPHRVFALDTGVVSTPLHAAQRRCVNRRLDVGHFSYWHVSPIRRAGTPVSAGQQIGWTCLGV
jgi:hypothetical protein